ncbi:hypothetical protein VTO42DRAFT_1201 [Malbranchea cinnamomea]
MLLSLGFKKSAPSRSQRSDPSTTSPAPPTANEVPNPTTRRLSASTSIAASSREPGSSSSSPSTNPTDTLRGSSSSRSLSRSQICVPTDADEKAREREELNECLVTLAQLFPDVKVEVFRELLMRFDGKSRLQVCVEQLLRHRSEWVKGRWKEPGDTTGARPTPTIDVAAADNASIGTAAATAAGIPAEELFRSEEYKAAVTATLSQEFRPLSKSTIAAVLAEVNYSYIQARPTLQELSRKTWRATLGTFLPFKKRKKGKVGHPLLIWQKTADGEDLPSLKETGCAELDKELRDAFLEPLLAQAREERETRDLTLATQLNEAEAEAAEALYECCCCMSDVTFEQISTCSTAGHFVCFTCIQRTLHEAVFGQGWAKAVEPQKSTLRCLAPLQTDTCDGTLDQGIVKRAILAEKAGSETYKKFEDRLASEALMKCNLKLIHCPFCSYAEVDPVYHPSKKGITWRFRRLNVLPAILLIIGLLDLIPLVIIPCIVLSVIHPSYITTTFSTSLRNLCLKTRNQRFTCSNPSCRRQSCITCHKPWRDPHRCHEPMLQSLRNAIEAARTAAIKRTCPRCGVSFVKSSGCNKLTCVCGYSMCYLCRKSLGPRESRAQRLRENIPPVDGNLDEDVAAGRYDRLNDEAIAAAALEDEEPEGYQHFCEHFRANPGSRCTQCTKCDLYAAEDEEAIVQRAGEKAEREWRARHGLLGSDLPAELLAVNSQLNEDTHGKGRGRRIQNRAELWTWEGIVRFWTQDLWRDLRLRAETQKLVDRFVENVVVIVDV